MKLDEKGRMLLRYLTVLIVMTAVIAAVLGMETAAAEPHEFDYVVSGNDPATITATCREDGCDVRATLMISAPADLIYDGRDKAAIVTGDTAMLGTPTITYKKDNDVLEGTPRNAGTYTASITLGEGNNKATASVSYTIIRTSPFCGTIKWVDGGKDHTGTTPPALTLYRAKEGEEDGNPENGTPVTNVTLRWNKNNTIFTYEDLPVNDESGVPYIYWVIESQVDGYGEPQYSNKGTNPPGDRLKNAGTITNSIQQEKITLEGAITWNHGSNPEAACPKTVTVYLQGNGMDLPNKVIPLDGIEGNQTNPVDYELAPAPDGGTWNFVFTGLDKYDSTGKEVIYTVREEYVPNYKTAYDNAHCNITNTYNTNTLGEILKVCTEVTVPANCAEWNWATNDPTFVFGLFGVSNTAGVIQPMPSGSVYGDEVCKRIEVTKDSAGHVASFGAVSFDVPGTYVYCVREMTPAESNTPRLPGMTYNTEVYTVTVVVNNRMNISVTVTNKAGETIRSVGGQYNLTKKNDSYVLPFINHFDMSEIDYAMVAEMAYVDHSKLDDSGYPLNVIGEVNGKFAFTMRPVGNNASDAPMPTDAFNSSTGCGLKVTENSRVYYARNVNNRVLFGADEANVIKFNEQNTGTYTYELAEIIPNGAVYIGNGFWYNDADETVYDGVVHTIKLRVEKADNSAITVTPSEEKADYLNPDMGTEYEDAGNASRVSLTGTNEYPRHKNGVPQFYNYKEPRINITATKVWDDANDKDKRRPGSVYFYIQREDGQLVQNVYGNTLTGDETKVKIAGTDTDCSLTTVWSNLPRYKRGNNGGTYEQITYKVFESANGEAARNSVPGYADQVITGDNEKGFTITNSMKAPAAIPGLVYNGEAQELVTPGDATGSTFWYALGESADTAPVRKFYTISIPTGIEAGTYYVWYKVIPDAGDSDPDPVCIKAEIHSAAYAALKVENTEYTIGSGKKAVITVTRNAEDNRTFSLYTGSSMDGKPIASGNCDTAPGSLILTLKANYLDSLSVGDHRLTIAFQDGSVDTTVKILPAAPASTAAPTAAPTATPRPVPKTGDTANPALWLALILLGLLGIGGLTVSRIMSRRNGSR